MLESSNLSIILECSLQGVAVCAVSSLVQLLSRVPSTTSLQVLELELVNLQVCADTMVGNQMVRGISGGQKKRVTSGGPRAFGSVTHFSPACGPPLISEGTICCIITPWAALAVCVIEYTSDHQDSSWAAVAYQWQVESAPEMPQTDYCSGSGFQAHAIWPAPDHCRAHH